MGRMMTEDRAVRAFASGRQYRAEGTVFDNDL